MMQLAPVEGQAFIDAMIRYKNAGLPHGVVSETQGKKAKYDRKGKWLSVDKAMEEVSADEVFRLYNNDTAAFKEALERVANGKDEKAKAGARKFKDILNDIIKKLKNVWNKLRGKDEAEVAAQIEQTIDEMSELRDLFEKALAVAAERVKAEQANPTKGSKKTAQQDGVQMSAKEYSAVREKLAKAALDKLSDRLGEQFPLSARFDPYIRNTKEVVSSPTVVANSVQANGRSYYRAAKDEFIRCYKKNETVNVAGTGIVAKLKTDMATESMSKGLSRVDEQVLLDVIPAANGLIAGGKLLGVERLAHTDNKQSGLFAYRVYNVFDYSTTDAQTKKVATKPYVFVATVVQQYDGDSIVHIIRGIEIAACDRGKLGKSEGSSPITSGKYMVAQLYKYVKSVPRADGGLKYTPHEASDYLFRYTQKEDGEMYSLREEAPPKNTKKAYKLMRLVDGKLYPLFIGNNEEVSVGTWYNADSPNLSQLKDLAPGTHLVEMTTGEAITWDEYAKQHVPVKNGKPARNKPNVQDIHRIMLFHFMLRI